MKINVIKLPGGGLIAATDMDEEKLKKFKNHEMFQIEIKNERNWKFHKKVIMFFLFCFEYWVSDNKYTDEATDFDEFRYELTILAGFKKVIWKLNGSFEYKAKSISYAKMDQEEFEHLYNALIQASMDTLFKDCDEYTLINDRGVEIPIYDKLRSFF